MKATRFIHVLFTAGTVLFFIFTSCKKKKEFKEEDGQASVEIRNAQAECDIILKDINEVMSADWLLRGKSALTDTGVFKPVCGMVRDTSRVRDGILRLIYDGSLCNGRKREGRVTLTIINYPLSKLKSFGSTVKIDFEEYRNTKMAFGNSLQFDGTAYLKNESGGSWFELVYLNQPSLIQTLTAEDLLTTINGSSAVYHNISRRFTYTYANSIISCTEEGTGGNKVENFGYTRAKQKFTSYITKPIRWNTICGPGFPLSGEVSIRIEDNAYDLQALYGTDSDGSAVTPTGYDCTYGWRLNWSYKRKTKTRVFGYDN